MDSQLLLNNVEIFNGKDARTFSGNLLIRNNRIETISAASIEMPSERPVTVIDGKGRFLMPGLIDAHWHAYLCCNTMTDLLAGDPSYTHLMAGREAAETLQRGFTAIRDAGGPVFGLKRAIDSGTLRGPRIYPSGAMISQTSGHGDFRMIYEHAHGGCGCEMAHVEQIGASKIADGADAVTAAVRENLRQGASQIKLMAGGGAASLYDPPRCDRILRGGAPCGSPCCRGLGHLCDGSCLQPAGDRPALKAGVRSIEHGHLIDEPTMAPAGRKRRMAQYAGLHRRGQHLSVARPASQTPANLQRNGSDIPPRQKHGVKLAWGTDLLFDPANTKNQNHGIVKLQKWFTNFEILRMVTCDNARLLALSGARNPYPGNLGVIEEGALADLLVIEGNPLERIEVLENPHDNLRVIVKDGVVCKNTL